MSDYTDVDIEIQEDEDFPTYADRALGWCSGHSGASFLRDPRKVERFEETMRALGIAADDLRNKWFPNMLQAMRTPADEDLALRIISRFDPTRSVRVNGVNVRFQLYVFMKTLMAGRVSLAAKLAHGVGGDNNGGGLLSLLPPMSYRNDDGPAGGGGGAYAWLGDFWNVRAFRMLAADFRALSAPVDLAYWRRLLCGGEEQGDYSESFGAVLEFLLNDVRHSIPKHAFTAEVLFPIPDVDDVLGAATTPERRARMHFTLSAVRRCFEVFFPLPSPSPNSRFVAADFAQFVHDHVRATVPPQVYLGTRRHRKY